MADINLVQEHHLAPEQARAAAQQVADKLAEQFELECQWDGDVLRFERSGVNGTLTLGAAEARLISAPPRCCRPKGLTSRITLTGWSRG